MSRFTLISAQARPPAPPPEPEGLDRRAALAWMAAGSAALMSGCSGKPPATALPYVEQPEGHATGEVRRYATTVPLAGYDRGVVGLCPDGRPVKLEGSLRHPASLGATDVFAEAEVLSLYDPGRLRTPETADGPADWSAFSGEWAVRLERARARGGAGFTLLTGRVVSPTELRLVAALRSALPGMTWRRFEPVDDDGARGGSRLAFGRVLDVRPRLTECAVVLCLGADPLGAGPDQVANGRAFAEARRPGRDGFQRLYAVEPGWSLTGMNADHRLPLTAAATGAFAYAVAERLGVSSGPRPRLSSVAERFAAAAADDLLAARGRAVVLAGRSQSAAVHALAHVINARLAPPVDVREPVDPHPEDHAASLAALAADLRAGRVETLVTLDANPAFDAPASLGMVDALKRAPWMAAAAVAPDETTALARWRLPLSHPLESWGDGRAADGTAALRQPLVRPLHVGRSAAELLAMLTGEAAPDGRALVRASWAERGAGDAFEAWWREALVAGVIVDSTSPNLPLPTAATPPAAPAIATGGGLELSFAPDPTLHDGRHAGNAWLQECPRPLTHEVWGASVAISAADAERLSVKTGDHVKLTAGDHAVEAPVRVTAGQAEGALTAFLGGGRRAAGPVGTGVGWDVAAIRSFAPAQPADRPLTTLVRAERAKGAGRPPTFASTPRLEGEAHKLSPVLAVGREGGGELDREVRPASLYPDPPPHSPSWAMVIDAAACIGCNACVVACQAENNVPVVGPKEVARGRDMHWLRIDAYDVSETEEVRPAFQPVPCMHCEHAPCEPVCPVEASVHDHEGLNAQVYNRCIGTRFCQANCPYKVRRFNFHGYAHEQAYADTGDDAYAAQKNPDVTVRARGVMEKCTYCVQRLSAARLTAERERRPLREGDAVTACQSACPTRAISFGDLTAQGSRVAALRTDPRHYALLGELGTRPRTTYLARLRNKNPALEGGA